MAGRKAVFLDRDGVLLPDEKFITSPAQVSLYPYVGEAVAMLCAEGFLVFVVSNQTVVARGLAGEKDVEEIHSHMQALVAETEGARIEKFYYCPHHPNATDPAYREVCDCRKPRPGMLLKAAEEFSIDLTESYMIGDRISDILAGQNAGCHTIQVRTGKHTAPAIETPDKIDLAAEADYSCDDLCEAAELIVELDRA